tara:strand:- start:4836 stop:5084 length:249 start_codon:yes stop_codon:yes gene_type:complete
MNEKFEFGSTEKLFERIGNDKSGELAYLVDEIILKCKQASDRGIPMDELASACTMGWFMGQDPQISKVYHFIIEQAKMKLKQ